MARIVGAAGALVLLLAAPAASQSFDFEGDDLAPGWEVTRPDPDAFIVEGGELLIVAAQPGGYADETAANVFELPDGVPEGDWTAELELTAEMQTAKEAISLGVAGDGGATVFATLYTAGDQYYGWSLNVGVAKRTGEAASSFAATVARLGCNVCGEDRSFQVFADSLAQPMRLQLEKSGRRYRARASLGGPEDEWVETFPVTVLREPSRLVLFATQTDDTQGETLFLIDSLEVTAK